MRSTMLFVILFLAAIPAAASGAMDVVPFTCDARGAVVVRLTIDDQGPFPFLLDTGSNRSAVSAGVATALGAAAVAKTEVITPAGRVWRKVVRLGRVSVGSRNIDGILATVLPHGELDRVGARVDGVLGQDFLSRFNYTLDYRHRRLSWGASDTGGIRLALVLHEGRFLVELPQRRNRSLFLVPDTGTSGIVLFTRGGKTPLPLQWIARASIEALAGSSGATTVRIMELTIGEMILRNQLAVAIDRPEIDAPMGDGLLPLHLFASVTFDAARNSLIVRR